MRTDKVHSSDDFVKKKRFGRKAKKSTLIIDAVPEISVVTTRVFSRVESPGSWAHRLTRQAMYVYRNIAAPSRKQFCREEAISIILVYHKSVSLPFFLHRILSSVACLAVPYFFRITS